MVAVEQDPRVRALIAACRELDEAMARFDTHAAEVLGVGATDLRALNLLEDGPLSAGAIAERLGLTSGSVTALLGSLAEAGYITVEVAADDRRRRDVRLTPATWQRFAQVYRPLGHAVGAAAEALDGEDLAAVLRVLPHLCVAFDTHLASTGVQPTRAPAATDG